MAPDPLSVYCVTLEAGAGCGASERPTPSPRPAPNANATIAAAAAAERQSVPTGQIRVRGGRRRRTRALRGVTISEWRAAAVALRIYWRNRCGGDTGSAATGT